MPPSMQPVGDGDHHTHHANAAAAATSTSFTMNGAESSSTSTRAGAPGGGAAGFGASRSQHQQLPSQEYAASTSYYASRDHDGNSGPARRPSAIATYQSLAHDPVYMAARTSPIGPPPRSALPALPPAPSGSGSGSRAAPTQPLPAIPNNSSNSGMLAMASESRPVTAVFNGDWAYPSPTNDPQQHQQGGTVNGNNSHQHRSQHSLQERAVARHGSTSASRQQQQQQPRRQEHNEYQHQSHHQYNKSSPSTSRHARNGTDASSTSSPPPAAAEAGPSGSQPAEGVEGGPERMASKTVLTIALMEAQNAVKLDESDQPEAALASYTKSVGLLEEVMRRVTENAGTYRQKEMDRLAQIKQDRIARWRQWRIEQYRRAGVEVTAEEIDVNDEEVETREERKDREKREARIARRDRMRVEECAKLKVIHDTYYERILALQEEIAENELQQPTTDRSSEPPASEPDTRRQLAGLAINEGHTMSHSGQAGPSNTPAQSRHTAVRSVDQTIDSAGRAHIGSAMLANSPLSPTFAQASSSSSTAIPSTSRLRSSVVPFPSSPPNSQNEARRSYISSTSASPPSLALPEIHPFSFSPANSAGRRSPNTQAQLQPSSSPPTQQNSVLSFSPDSEDSQSLQFSDQQQQPPPSSSSAKSHRKNASSSGSYNKTYPSPEGYSTFGDFAGQTVRRQPSPKPPTMPLHPEQDEQDVPGGLTTPTPDTANSKTFASPPSSHGDRKTQPSEGTRSRASSRASNALRHMTSSESLASNTTSSSAGAHWSNTAQKMPLPPVPAVPEGSPVSPPLAAPGSAGSRMSIVGASRPLRSASLVAGQAVSDRPGQSAPQNNLSSSTSSEKQRANAFLVNPSTLHGTISQRRKSPNMPDSATFPSSEEDNTGLGVPSSDAHPGMSSLDLTRSSSTERGTSSRNSTYKGTAGPAGSSQVTVGPTGPQPFNVAGSLPMRLRALSQPSKRPGIPSFNSDFGQPVPPLPGTSAPAPTMQRADSDPAGIIGSEQPPPTPVMPSTPMSFEYPPSMEDSIYSVPGISVGNDETGDQAISPTSTQGGGLSKANSRSFIEPETPASAVFQQNAPSSLTKGPTVEYQAPPSDAMRLPFHFMRQIRTSILSGAYLTPRLYIPKQLWGQPSMKLVHTETKVRMLDLLLNGLESIERTGDVLLLDGQIKAGNTGSKIDAANRLMRELESFEGMLDSIQSTLAKKLTYVEQPNGKKGGGGSFGAWSSKISRSMDRMTKGKNLDAPETYVAAIARLCLHAQILDRHLASLHGTTVDANANGFNGGTVGSRASQEFRFGGTSSSSSALSPSTATPGGYGDIPADRRVYIETRLKRSSDFFSKVICKMFLNDLGIWLDKYSKRAAGWTTD